MNLIVTLYLDFVELQATNGRFMKMNDWIQKLDDFLKIREKELLKNAGSVSHKQAIEKQIINTKNIEKLRIKNIFLTLIER